ncbi:cytoplasmic tRNA 2-thiolation protein 1, partial [Cuculus canorus]|uniref:cytoplasmic tRNA 2-thiolation protein 1 n=1 Tax=Cuculus canorus TaxID=55661 RepID=UPI0023AA4E78
MPRCARCPLPARLLRPRTSERLCRRCFSDAFEAETLRAILSSPSPSPGASVAVAASGGKDSTVLAHLLERLEFRHRLGYRMVLLSVDEGIAGYREAALDAVRRSRRSLPLVILSHRQLFGWSVDEVGKNLGAGSRCTFCGVWRRQALERGARMLGADWIATGHNADDIAETVLMNFLRGDVARLRRAATEATAGDTGDPTETTGNPMETTRNPTETTRNPTETTRNPSKTPQNLWNPPKNLPELSVSSGSSVATGEASVATPWPSVPRWKPLRHAYEKDIVLYAYLEGLDYVSTECVYAPRAYRGHARDLLKDLEATRATTVAALGHSGRRLTVATKVATKKLGGCRRCGFAASQVFCKACVLVASLEKGLPKVGLGKRALEVATGLEE